MIRTKYRRQKPDFSAYNRTTSDLPLNARTAEVVVDDPYELGAKLTVTRSLRDDPLARLRDREQIDEAQFIAGRHWQRDFEAAEIGGISAIDTTKEPVDGRKFPDHLTDKHREAIKAISEAGAMLGIEGDALVRDFLGKRMWMDQIAALRGFSNQRSLDYLARRCRECLETLAYFYGYAQNQPRRGVKCTGIRVWRSKSS